MKCSFSASIAGSLESFDEIAAWPEFSNAGLPERVRVGSEKLEPTDWRQIRSAQNPTGGLAFWDEFRKQLAVRPDRGIVIFDIPDFQLTVESGLSRVLPLPFQTVELGTPFPDVLRVNQGYDAWSLAGGHIDHGWGCLFRGSGHERLVSRRWLDHGPWRVVHLPNDTTFVQFHDLSITDPVEAYEQAKHGHQRMGIDPTGGYIQGIDTDVFSELTGTYYYEDTRLLEIVIPSKIEVTQQNMRVACALRLHDRLQNRQDGRVERVAYVFINRADAEAHLHELWLRELECWYVDETGKHRLDEAYRPTPQPPAWVARLKDSSVNDLPAL